MSREWPEADEANARALMRRGYSYRAIGAMIGRTEGAVYAKLNQRYQANEKVQIANRPLPEQLAERDRRLTLPVRDLTGAFFGDPPVGLSALERRT